MTTDSYAVSVSDSPRILSNIQNIFLNARIVCNLCTCRVLLTHSNIMTSFKVKVLNISRVHWDVPLETCKTQLINLSPIFNMGGLVTVRESASDTNF